MTGLLYKRIVSPFLCSILLTMMMGLLVFYLSGWNISNTVFVGKNFGATKYWSNMFLYESGYDGQFYFYIAHNPFDTQYLSHILDVPAHRYKRILYPLAVWLITRGSHQDIPYVMFIVNLIVIPLITVLINLILMKLRVEKLFYYYVGMFIPSFIYSLKYNLSEPLASVLLICAILLLLNNKNLFSGLLFLLSSLSKEVFVIVPTLLVFYSILYKKKIFSLVWFLPVVGLFLWNYIVYELIFYSSHTIRDTILDHYNNPISNLGVRMHNEIMQIINNNSMSINTLLTLIFIIFVVFTVLIAIHELIKNRNKNIFTVCTIVTGCIVLIYGRNIWIISGPESYLRVSEIFFMMSLLHYSIINKYKYMLLFYPALFVYSIIFIMTQNDIGLLNFR